METYLFGSDSAPNVLIQPVDSHDLEGIENEVKTISELTNADFRMIAVRVPDWNRDLSPWTAPAVFGKESFGDGAGDFLEGILPLCPDGKTCYIGGYSLAGLFALWAAYRTGRFAGVAAASPSVWFPGFTDFMQANRIQSKAVYLSLGDREEKAKNPVMAAVGSRIREAEGILKAQGIPCTLEWNPGNHFRDADIRTAKAFAWVLNHTPEDRQ
ncbi:esterase [Clostridiales bacterium]|nr:esterase [Clostridiales bacterium]